MAREITTWPPLGTKGFNMNYGRAFVVFVIASVTGCSVGVTPEGPLTELPWLHQIANRLDPEEEGYYQLFGNRIVGVSNCASWFSVGAQAHQNPASNAVGHSWQIGYSEKHLRNHAAQILVDLKNMQPPADFVCLHFHVIDLLSRFHDSKKFSHAEIIQIRSKCDSLFAESKRVGTTLKHRPQRSTDLGVKVEFQPVFTNIAIDVADGTRRLVQESDFDVVIGKVLISPREAPRLDTLILRSQGKIRRFAITDRRLDMPVAASWLTIEGATITLDADMALLLAKQMREQVLRKEEATHTRPPVAVAESLAERPNSGLQTQVNPAANNSIPKIAKWLHEPANSRPSVAIVQPHVIHDGLRVSRNGARNVRRTKVLLSSR